MISDQTVVRHPKGYEIRIGEVIGGPAEAPNIWGILLE